VICQSDYPVGVRVLLRALPQVVMLLYLLLVWPFTTWQLQTAELICHVSELSIFVSALALSFSGESLGESAQKALQILMLGKQCDMQYCLVCV
jgi:hypothetical protein